MSTIHATCIAFSKTGVLIRGPSGSGKSSLALRLIDGEGYGLGKKALRATLVADDQIQLTAKGGYLFASPAPRLAGLIEVRGVGILKAGYQRHVPIKLVVDLRPADTIERLPEENDSVELEGISVPRIHLDAGSAHAPAALRAALGRIVQTPKA